MSARRGKPLPADSVRARGLVPTELGIVQCVPLSANVYNGAPANAPCEVTAALEFLRRLMDPTDTHGTEYFHRVVDCQWACPAHTDVPEYIRLVAQGRFGDAYLLNRQSNVFPGILGRVCDRPC